MAQEGVHGLLCEKPLVFDIIERNSAVFRLINNTTCFLSLG